MKTIRIPKIDLTDEIELENSSIEEGIAVYEDKELVGYLLYDKMDNENPYGFIGLNGDDAIWMPSLGLVIKEIQEQLYPNAIFKQLEYES